MAEEPAENKKAAETCIKLEKALKQARAALEDICNDEDRARMARFVPVKEINKLLRLVRSLKKKASSID